MPHHVPTTTANPRILTTTSIPRRRTFATTAHPQQLRHHVHQREQNRILAAIPPTAPRIFTVSTAPLPVQLSHPYCSFTSSLPPLSLHCIFLSNRREPHHIISSASSFTTFRALPSTQHTHTHTASLSNSNIFAHFRRNPNFFPNAARHQDPPPSPPVAPLPAQQLQLLAPPTLPAPKFQTAAAPL